MAIIADVSRSVASTSTGTLNLPILSAPNANTLAEFGLAVSGIGAVQLGATIGIQTTLGVPNVIFTILRDGNPVFNVGASGLSVLAIQPITISFLDLSVPAGYHAYTLIVSNNSTNVALNLASITGPVAFSGISIS
ncbi:hypothetical protein F4V43_03440 [Paenibacillus spiritus]|uniref:Exosporium leader peptide n=1 Tax=Paenibacillus spiritus TaxID=2496557 RepID=A0A5J5GHJ3_9BACL|nr:MULTISPECIES: hypothetical protein [Paenibacillus]KAA9007557.1 hypothetical protein F4V43_03440 [Paenibacillus spiritus]